MKDRTKPLTKRDALMIALKIFIFTSLFVVIAMYLMYGRIPVIPILIAIGIFIPILVISFFIGYKQRKKLEKKHGKNAQKIAVKNYSKFLRIMGGILIVISIPLIITNQEGITSYINLILGVIFLITGRYYSKNKTKK